MANSWEEGVGKATDVWYLCAEMVPKSYHSTPKRLEHLGILNMSSGSMRTTYRALCLAQTLRCLKTLLHCWTREWGCIFMVCHNSQLIITWRVSLVIYTMVFVFTTWTFKCEYFEMHFWNPRGRCLNELRAGSRQYLFWLKPTVSTTQREVYLVFIFSRVLNRNYAISFALELHRFQSTRSCGNTW